MMKQSRLSGILFAAAMAGAAVPTAANAQALSDSTVDVGSSFCSDPNLREAPRRIRNITRDNAVQIYSSCVDATSFVEAIQILTLDIVDLGPNRWLALGQLFSIYDEKVRRQETLTANLVEGARNPETGRKWNRRQRDQFQLELLETNAWISTVNNAVSISAAKQWRDANAPTIESITPIANTPCQNEIRVRFNVQNTYMTCGAWRAPVVGPLRYQRSANEAPTIPTGP